MTDSAAEYFYQGGQALFSSLLANFLHLFSLAIPTTFLKLPLVCEVAVSSLQYFL